VGVVCALCCIVPLRSSVDISKGASSVTVVGKTVEITESLVSCQLRGGNVCVCLRAVFLVLRAECDINYRAMFGYFLPVI
jgi:hypothetical protein